MNDDPKICLKMLCELVIRLMEGVVAHFKSLSRFTDYEISISHEISRQVKV